MIVLTAAGPFLPFALAVLTGAGDPGAASAALAPPPGTAGVAVGQDEAGAPPGLVLVPAGRYEIGSSEELVAELIRRNRQVGPSYAGELGGKPVQLPGFRLMPTEVTNEQYAVFVRDTGHQPPEHWAGAEALAAASATFAEEQQQRISAALAEGRPAPTRLPFDRRQWWNRHWQETPWAVPAGLETTPVVFVDYADCTAYAEWAGLRLPTEFEFQAAARGRTEHQWPWGPEWNPKNAVCNSETRGEVRPAGSTGYVTEQGLHDLIGNVWEWTSSPFTPYDKYKPIKVELPAGRRTESVTFDAEFDANMRVLVGGSAGFDGDVSRAAVRRRSDRDQRADLLGFRCASSLQPGADAAAGVLTRLGGGLRPKLPLAPQSTVSCERWQSSPGTANLPGYAVIERHDALLAIPVERVEARNREALVTQTHREGPVGLALISTTVPILEPALEPGTYLLSWRAKGKDRREEEPEAEGGEGGEGGEPPTEGVRRSAQEEPVPTPAAPQWPEDRDVLILQDHSGAVVAILPGEELDLLSEDPAQPFGRLSLAPWVEPKKPDPTAVPVDTLQLTVDLPSQRAKKVVRVPLTLRLAAGTVDASWRGLTAAE
jgi:sulfatase modifying factor 1